MLGGCPYRGDNMFPKIDFRAVIMRYGCMTHHDTRTDTQKEFIQKKSKRNAKEEAPSGGLEPPASR